MLRLQVLQTSSQSKQCLVSLAFCQFNTAWRNSWSLLLEAKLLRNELLLSSNFCLDSLQVPWHPRRIPGTRPRSPVGHHRSTPCAIQRGPPCTGTGSCRRWTRPGRTTTVRFHDIVAGCTSGRTPRSRVVGVCHRRFGATDASAGTPPDRTDGPGCTLLATATAAAASPFPMFRRSLTLSMVISRGALARTARPGGNSVIASGCSSGSSGKARGGSRSSRGRVIRPRDCSGKSLESFRSQRQCSCTCRLWAVAGIPSLAHVGPRRGSCRSWDREGRIPACKSWWMWLLRTQFPVHSAGPRCLHPAARRSAKGPRDATPSAACRGGAWGLRRPSLHGFWREARQRLVLAAAGSRDGRRDSDSRGVHQDCPTRHFWRSFWLGMAHQGTHRTKLSTAGI
mmetsp:Transcript_47250/g.101720  ORF Transcript_47250/g.101720 Transcript_47250/m.101720 type:complete len:396 (+) Transcript_47250:330-1517(+)